MTCDKMQIGTADSLINSDNDAVQHRYRAPSYQDNDTCRNVGLRGATT